MNVRYGLCDLMLIVAALFQPNSALIAQDVAAAARANRANHNNTASSVKPDNEGERFLSVSVPGESWTVRIDAPDFVVSQDDIKGEGKKYFMATNTRSNIVLSVTLEKVNGQAEVEECRSSLQKRIAGDGPFKFTDARTREINGVPAVEYMVPEVEGVKIQQGNIFACMVNKNVYVDIHLSKAQFRPEDETLFEAVLKAIRIDSADANESSAVGGNARQLFADGSRAYLQGNFAAAIGPYQQALDLEKKHPTLGQTLNRVLIDNLGMAYGITGDLGKAADVFNYGVSKDPNYPMFYYNIACVYGEKHDMANAITNLQKAFANRAYGIPGEGIPDPRKDDSFTAFMRDDRFVRIVSSLVESAR
jgi:tetratricopeptide (TPR) repeat protein